MLQNPSKIENNGLSRTINFVNIWFQFIRQVYNKNFKAIVISDFNVNPNILNKFPINYHNLSVKLSF